MKKGLRRVAAVAVATLVVAPALATVASATSTFAFDRKAGADRYATSVEVAKTYGASTHVILASGVPGHYPDALTASYLAGVKKAPIMLTLLAATPANVIAQITASGATDVWLIGGTGVISAAQEAALDVKFGTIHRLGGLDRYLTAEKVIAEGGASATTAVLATGVNFPDAIAGGPLAYAKDMPLAITATNTLPASTLTALKTAGVTKVIALGGPTIITSAVLATLATNGITLDQRIYGANRSETSSKLADYMLASQGFVNTGVNVASGYGFGTGADALGGAPLSGKEVRPTLITESVTTIGPGVLGYLTAHCSTLASGHIFGGVGAVSAASEAAMQAAGRCASTQSFTVTGPVVGSTFKYADPTTGTEKTATFKTTDVFTVDGVTATLAVFLANLTVGDLVTILANTPTAGVTTYQLVNVDRAKIASGLVGDVNQTDPVHPTYVIMDPVTGTTLTDPAIDYDNAFTLYTLNGAASTLAAISLNINEGDTIVSTGTGADAAHIRTIALTNTTVTGTASGITNSATNPVFFIDTAAGASLGDVVTAATDVGYTLDSAASITVDGVSATVAQFNTALTVGDTISYSRAANVQTVALTNKVAAPFTAVVAQGAPSTMAALSYARGTSAVVSKNFVTPADYTFYLNGVLATVTEMNDALTAGDSINVQVPDTATSTVGFVKLTDGSLTGPLADVNVGATTVDVLSAGDYTLYNNLNYTAFGFYAGNTSATYFINGVSKTLANFNSELSVVANGTKTGTISVVDNGAVTEFRITTATNTASAKMVANSVVVVNATTITVTFDKPVYLSEAWAAADFTITPTTGTYVDSAVSPTTLGTISNTVTLTVVGVAPVAPVTVTLSVTGAAKFLDANGTAATAGSTTT